VQLDVNTISESCWHGEGVDCFHGGDIVPTYGARVMHGEVRVLADLKGVQILGLQPAFDAYYFINQSHDAVDACRNHCYSNAECEYWQYSKSKGCWTENPDLVKWTGLVEFPITTRSWLRDTDFAASVIAGEYIQHICKGTTDIPEMFSVAFVPSDLPMGPDAPSPERSAPSHASDHASSTIGPAPPILALSLADGEDGKNFRDVLARDAQPLAAEPSPEFAHGSLLLLAVISFILAATVGLICSMWPQVRGSKSTTRHVELEETSTHPLTSAADDDQSWRPDWLESQSTVSSLPFPEAGLPPRPRQGLPFPEVGLGPSGGRDNFV
jgi:hypothetical protein